MRVLLAALAAALVLLAPPALNAQDAQLTLMRARMSENLQHLPNYTCVETLERLRRAQQLKIQMSDRVRLEVALVKGREMFAWPGSGSFEDSLSDNLIKGGAFGFGNFALYARAIFVRKETLFGEPEVVMHDGRRLLRWKYRVPRYAGGIQIEVGDRAALVGFEGYVYAEPDTLDAAEIVVIADPAPKEMGSTQNQDTVRYARVPIGDGSFLLPVSSDLMMSTVTSLYRNHVTFSMCHEFVGESTLVFDFDPSEEGDAADQPAAARQRTREVTLPEDQKLELTLLAPLDMRTASAGDPVRAELRKELKWDGQVRVPKGAVARGRITRVERYEKRVVLGLSFNDLDWPGGHAPLKLRFDGANKGLDHVHDLDDLLLSSEFREGEGVVSLSPSRDAVERGVRFTWRTDP